MPLAQFVSLAEVSGVSLISLQHSQGREQLAALAERFRVVDLGKDVDCRAGAFMDTAAIIENLDLVITSDTSTAHVAGGLAARTWLAVSFSPEWRWMRQGDTNPWYPTMRLFRQQSRGEWSGVFCADGDRIRTNDAYTVTRRFRRTAATIHKVDLYGTRKLCACAKAVSKPASHNRLVKLEPSMTCRRIATWI